MITTDERTAIIKALGSKPLKQIHTYLYESKIFNKNQQPYSKTFISYILSGERENERIENAIFACAHLKILQKEKQQELRNKVVFSNRTKN
ncbi:hypothetical protein NBT05_08245 [Aquimarina sp. ERC-38]|uniref:hypothetical protein n=1 Tax=Aquimarina sp. ERC-38 TaxID=2949996 RepID=UPI002248444F|nr:hypothetical protein [Aquimarina sp. ERC-38]UZO82451.1 hypothetical protein NBT05_08245 [Aquimarina sp. ERC-38]